MTSSAVILDDDDTLVDSNYQHTLAWARALSGFDLSVPLWRIHRQIGKGGDRMYGGTGDDTFYVDSAADVIIDNAGAGSFDYMQAFGLVALGFMWAKMAEAAYARKARDPSQAARMDAKLATGKFFMERMLPETALRLERISTGCDTMMSVPAEMF